ncbi:MAG TPA: 2-oxoacid:ferredoxin oxidoreductase subunit beta [Cyclobacteriaceae bacterium]|jgi:2-oxoglutarate ferredoxin oxidoreductase subunit beta
MSNIDIKPLTKKDFASDQLVRWCPGCGDYSILSAMQLALPQLGLNREDIVFVSGIGCAARFPYYMNTYGFHTIHGRGPAVATGVKLANPKLSVWEIQGDGDALAIGGNHFIHVLRRNVNINILLFNNEIYGLTKGQYSPTSRPGLVTKSTPFGVIDRPFHAAELVIGAQGTFYARTIDTNPKLMSEIFVHAAGHTGTSMVEILQNCVIFNDKTHGAITSKENRDDYQLHLEHGKPMLFGKDNSKGIKLNGLKLEVVNLGENGTIESDILIHDAYDEDPTLHLMLARMHPPLFPMALGVIREVRNTTYDELVESQYQNSVNNAKFSTMDELLNSGETWEVK